MTYLLYLHGLYGHGKFAIVDDEDFSRAIEYRWTADKRGYVSAKIDYKRVFLHRFILMLDNFDGTMVDHKNRNPLDNRKDNLRKCTNSQNQANTDFKKGTRTKGIYFYKNKWVSRIQVNGNRIYLGRFSEKQQALESYRLASLHYFGEFSYADL